MTSVLKLERKMIEYEGTLLEIVVIEGLGEEEYLMDEDENIYDLGYEFLGKLKDIQE